MIARRILVVDDSPVTRSLLTRTLARSGFEVLQARDGIEGAVTALRECPQAIVTDLEMPNMDGLQLVRLLKSDPVTAKLPVLILTRHDEAALRYWGRQTGADAYPAIRLAALTAPSSLCDSALSESRSVRSRSAWQDAVSDGGFDAPRAMAEAPEPSPMTEIPQPSLEPAWTRRST